MRPYLPRESFTQVDRSYRLLPFRFTRIDSAREVLVNEVGEYIIAPPGTARSVIKRDPIPPHLYARLRAKHFIHDDASSPLLDVLATKYRTRRSFLDGFTQLHIFVTTRRCNHSCVYCQVSRRSPGKSRFDMSYATAERSIDLMMHVPASCVTMEFQGGEPLLDFPLLQQIVERARRQAELHGKDLRIVLATNLTVATDDMLRCLRDQEVFISTSLDGPAFIHNANRPMADGNGNSHDMAVRNIERARNLMGMERVAALMTTSKLSLSFPVEIIDEYLRMDFRSIFLRPISPYGFALRNGETSSYTVDDFLGFYFKGLGHILELNRNGITFEEVYAKLLLTKILTPFPINYVDLQSPAGAGISVVVYNHDGDVYATDESRMLAAMGDRTFRLGNVHTDGYEKIFSCDTLVSLVAASVVESLPGCSDCAFQSYCGADPVYHYETQGDIRGNRPTSGLCKKNSAIIRHLFNLLASADRALWRIFFSWIREKSLAEMSGDGES